MRTRFFLIALYVLFFGKIMAQQPDSLRILRDSVSVVASDSSVTTGKKEGFVHRFFTKDYPKPGRAALLSLVLPGAGQAYNKRWWKLPIVYAALGTAMYFEVNNINQYRELRDNYRLLVDGDENTNPTESPYDQMDATTMKNYRDQWRRYVEFSSLALGGIYLLQVTDAFVDAHLQSFNVSDDLSLRFRPKMEATSGLGPAFGLGVSLQFSSNRHQTFFISKQ